MTTALERVMSGPAPAEVAKEPGPPSPAALLYGPLAIVIAVGGAVVARDAHGQVGQWVRVGLVVAWAIAGMVATRRRPEERIGPLALRATAIGAVASACASLLAADGHGVHLSSVTVDLLQFVEAIAVGVLPIAGMHIVLGLPDGSCKVARWALAAGYPIGVVVGVLVWTQRPGILLWPIVLESVLAATVGVIGSNHRYRRSTGVERQRMQWFGWAVAVGTEVVLIVLALRVLAGWPPHVGVVCAAATLPIPLAILVGSSNKLIGRIDRLLAQTVSIAGLSFVVVAVYLVIVLGLGRVPTKNERSLLVLSMIAAAVAAALYLPTRERLARFSNRLVYGEREAPDMVLRTFGSRLSRAVPLDELLLQVAESLRKTLALTSAEVWTGSGGRLERTVTVPDTKRAHITLSPDEETVVARAGVSGPAWLQVWLPQLLAGREDAIMRVAPITHSGQLLGLIVAVRPPNGDAFRTDDETVLAELARQVGLALHNVQLDSALQASLDEVRRQAEELRASRARIVAASDAARRQIERNLHDGAQQHLVALAVNLRLARQLAEADPETSTAMLDQLAHDLQEAVQQLRDLAHGIYPPLLMDRGLVEALQAAAGRAALPTDVEAEDLGRFSPDLEAAVYFCCMEALQNAGKHAGEGATATVKVWKEEGALLFEVADNGAGFDAGSRSHLGAGFTNMSDRVGAIGGSLKVQSAPGKGTKISGRIPVSETAPAPTPGAAV
ncbi:MAG TPA: histidine kinase [Acidimicrobiales bacterium]|jgi:signal transduction histidine kinase|nr:histidine kinase [Acidimicrobiales bacterium]